MPVSHHNRVPAFVISTQCLYQSGILLGILRLQSAGKVQTANHCLSIYAPVFTVIKAYGNSRDTLSGAVPPKPHTLRETWQSILGNNLLQFQYPYPLTPASVAKLDNGR